MPEDIEAILGIDSKGDAFRPETCQTQQAPSGDLFYLGVSILAVAMFWAAWIRNTYIAFEPLCVLRDEAKQEIEQFKKQYGFHSPTDLYEAMLTNEKVAKHVQRATTRRNDQFSFIEFQITSHWQASLYLFTAHSSIEGALKASEKSGRIGLFLPGIIETALLTLLGTLVTARGPRRSKLCYIGTLVAGWLVFFLLPDGSAKSQRIVCLSHLKKIGVSAQIYADDHDNVQPKDFLSMSNELITPIVLICPADKSRTKFGTAEWSQIANTNFLTLFELRNSSYEIVSPGVKLDKPIEIYVRCPIHNFYW